MILCYFAQNMGFKVCLQNQKLFLFISHTYRNNLNIQHFEKSLASINVMHKYKGHYLDTKHPIIVENLLGIKRQIGVHSKSKKTVINQ